MGISLSVDNLRYSTCALLNSLLRVVNKPRYYFDKVTSDLSKM